jgi:D-alanyl-D-alanine carboxypeptidase/D-alanyl-D-alanine-endopeptidase (penicillin-binding protein 4)
MRLFYGVVLGVMIALIHPALAKTKHKYHRISKTSSAKTAPVYGASSLGAEINSIINTSNVNAAIAVYVKSMTRGDSLYSRNIYRPFIPASTLKVLTSEAAFVYLGPDYRFSTQLLTDAKTIKDGVLQGNLYIQLSGDPTLTYADLSDLLLTLKTKQIQTIAGNVYIDYTAYDQNFYGPGWEYKDTRYCYGAPISASIINHNCLNFQVAPSSVAGRSAEVLTSSKYFYPDIKNAVTTIKKVSTRSRRSRSCTLRLSTTPGSEITLEGCMPTGQYAWGVSYVVSNIPAYNRALFSDLLNRLSIHVRGAVTFASTPRPLFLMGSHDSKPLRMLISDMMKRSDNVIAGALFKKLGQAYSRRQGSWETGSLAVSHILAKDIGVDIRGMRVLDGSGLSAGNLATPAQLMQVLNYAYQHPTSEQFISALPIAGVDGTLKHRMGNIARKVRAKTGSISGVISLAGYATTRDKEPLGFVIMINGSKGNAWRYRTIEDKIATALTRYSRS